MRTRKAAFWLTVAGVALLANVGVELLADKCNLPGLSRLVAYMHRGPSGGMS